MSCSQQQSTNWDGAILPRFATLVAAVLTAAAACPVLCLGQSAGDLVSSLEKRSVVLRNYYTDASLTFDSDGKLVSRGTPGFGPADGRLYIERAEVTDNKLTLVGERPVYFWDPNASEFRLTKVGRRAEVRVTLPASESINDALPRLINQIFLKQSDLQQIKCSDSDGKIHGTSSVRPAQSSKKPVARLPEAKTANELHMMCFPDGERAYSVQPGVRPPAATFTPDPEYTQAARKEKIQGTVVLALIVEDSGKPSTIVVTRSLGYGLDAKALDAVSSWRFKPATFQGKAIPVSINVEATFYPR